MMLVGAFTAGIAWLFPWIVRMYNLGESPAVDDESRSYLAIVCGFLSLTQIALMGFGLALLPGGLWMGIADFVVFTMPWMQGVAILIMLLARVPLSSVLRHSAIALGQGVSFYSLYWEILSSV